MDILIWLGVAFVVYTLIRLIIVSGEETERLSKIEPVHGVYIDERR